MPYVQVWIDEPQYSPQLDVMESALECLRRGDVEGAIAHLAPIVRDAQWRKEEARNKEFEELYDDWAKLPRKSRVCFLDYAHKRRKATKV